MFKTINYRAKSRQQGVALITVLLVFALVAVIGSEIASRNFRDIKQTANLINNKQAYYYALAGEQYARQILHADYQQRLDAGESQLDTLKDNWSNIKPVFDIENGSMSIVIQDLQGRFNINNIINQKGIANSKVLTQFSNLISTLDINRNKSALLADWLDSDSQQRTNGAEDPQYLDYNYLAANQAMADRSELLLLKDVSALDYQRLKPFVVALPHQVARGDNNQQASVTTAYNLNTVETVIIESLVSAKQQLSPAAISRQQQRGGFESVQLWQASGLIDGIQALSSQLSVDSEYFEVVVTAVYDQRSSVLRSQLYRDKRNGNITLIKRQQGFE
jgi:general secretion pathway protein K